MFGGEIKKLRGCEVQRIFYVEILKPNSRPSGIVTGIPLRKSKPKPKSSKDEEA